MTSNEGLSWWEKARFFLRVRQRLAADVMGLGMPTLGPSLVRERLPSIARTLVVLSAPWHLVLQQPVASSQ